MADNQPYLFDSSEPTTPAPKKKKSYKPEPREAIIRRMLSSADIKEDDIEHLGHGEWFDSILELLLRDQTRGQRVVPIHEYEGNNYALKHFRHYYHILWATTDYQRRGDGYFPTDEIHPRYITRKNNRVVRPRAVKSKEEQQRRIKQKAEVFTPSWVCNAQNNLIDEAWFGRKNVFNKENKDHTWTTNPKPIRFSKTRGKTWLDYVTERRLELCCGEGPYIVSRYDTTTGEIIPLQDRIGLLDRKMRVVGENAQDLEHWREYAYKAIRSVYGFEGQGDNLLLARENVLVSFMEYYYDFCEKKGIQSELSTLSLAHVAYIISWNLWQMDGIRYIIPYTDQEAFVGAPKMEFEETAPQPKSNPTGIYAKIAQWTGDGRQKYLKPIEFRNLIKSK